MGEVVAGNLDVRHCRILIAVHDEGSVAAAAAALGLAQSTVSETLSSLERAIGAPAVLRRPGREAQLTATALTLLPHARSIVLAVEAALDAVRGGPVGGLRLGTVESISSFLLPEPLGAFRSRRPGLEVRVSVGLCEDLRKQVARGELDLALTIEGARLAHAGAHAGEPRVRVAMNSRLGLIASPGNPLTRRPVGPDTLAGRTLLLADPEGAFTRLMAAWCETGGAGANLQSAGSVEGVKRAVRESDAVGVLPDYAVAEEVVSGTLSVLETTRAMPEIALLLTTVEGRQEHPALNDLLEEIEAAFSRRGERPKGAPPR